MKIILVGNEVWAAGNQTGIIVIQTKTFDYRKLSPHIENVSALLTVWFREVWTSSRDGHIIVWT